jgi:hypothetical protein
MRTQISSPTHRKTNQFYWYSTANGPKLRCVCANLDHDASRFYKTSSQRGAWYEFLTLPCSWLNSDPRETASEDRLYECKRLGTCTAPVSLSSQAHTGCHDGPNSFFDVRHGESFTSRLRATIEARLPPLEVLNFSDRGVIGEGNRAVLVVLREDPTEDIRATRGIDRVLCGGVEYYHYP